MCLILILGTILCLQEKQLVNPTFQKSSIPSVQVTAPPNQSLVHHSRPPAPCHHLPVFCHKSFINSSFLSTCLTPKQAPGSALLWELKFLWLEPSGCSPFSVQYPLLSASFFSADIYSEIFNNNKHSSPPACVRCRHRGVFLAAETAESWKRMMRGVTQHGMEQI